MGSWHEALGSTSCPSSGRTSSAIAQVVCTKTTPRTAPMFSLTLRSLRARSAAPLLRATYASTPTTSDHVPANDPVQRDAKQTVSETNAVPTSSKGSFDKTLQESVAKAEELRTTQAPNRAGIWSRSQQPREVAMRGPRFEQTIIEDQVCLFT